MKLITYKQFLDEKQIPFLEKFLGFFCQVIEIVTLVSPVPKKFLLAQIVVFINKIFSWQESLTT